MCRTRRCASYTAASVARRSGVHRRAAACVAPPGTATREAISAACRSRPAAIMSTTHLATTEGKLTATACTDTDTDTDTAGATRMLDTDTAGVTRMLDTVDISDGQ